MKNFLPPFLAGFALMVSGCAQQSTALYQYPFSSAKIEYAISGTTEGKSTVLIKGDKEVKEAHIVFHKKTGDENQDNLYIDTGAYVYSIDLDKKTGTLTPNPLYSTLIKVDPSERLDFLKKIAVGIDPDATSTQQIAALGSETVAGQSCQDYETGGFGIICLWNNIPLKTNISIPDFGLNNSTIATSVQTNIDIADSAFDVPAGISIKKIGIEELSASSIQGTQSSTQAAAPITQPAQSNTQAAN